MGTLPLWTRFAATPLPKSEDFPGFAPFSRPFSHHRNQDARDAAEITLRFLKRP